MRIKKAISGQGTAKANFWSWPLGRLFLFPYRIRVSKGPSGGPVWHIAQKDIVQTAFARWRGDSKIVEASAEHDFCFPRLIGMSRATECAQIFCAICQTGPPDGPFDTRILIGNCFAISYDTKTLRKDAVGLIVQ